jgi:hypothetical protein
MYEWHPFFYRRLFVVNLLAAEIKPWKLTPSASHPFLSVIH